MDGGSQYDETYQFNLPAKYKLIAQEELREDDNIRSQALAQFREWIAKHPHIKKCRTDSVFLLRFLRTKKFSVPLACEVLEKYLQIRQLHPQWFTKLDIEDPDLLSILENGYLVPLPQRDEKGRQVIFSCAGKFDSTRYTSAQMARAHSLVCETLMDEEESQIAGFSHINDEAGLTMGLVSLWSFTDLRNMLKCIQNSTPMRLKQTHFVNMPSYANKVVEFSLSILSDKLGKRIVVHKTLDDLKNHINPAILPKEYGGTVPMSEMLSAFLVKCRKNRAKVVALDDMHIEITKGSTSWLNNDNNQIDKGVIGSFRKLEVD